MKISFKILLELFIYIHICIIILRIFVSIQNDRVHLLSTHIYIVFVGIIAKNFQWQIFAILLVFVLSAYRNSRPTLEYIHTVIIYMRNCRFFASIVPIFVIYADVIRVLLTRNASTCYG